ncbi:MAG: SulP family inorganic anion transporter [Granulosicoccaceae bacterium]|jgi:SulP family sulfate permease
MSARLNAGEIWGGVAASSVILPQAMAFGVALWGSFSTDVASGAMAGLFSAALFSLVSGIAGGTRGMISAPTGPTLVLVSGTAISLTRLGLTGDQVLLSLIWVLLLAGIGQVLMGLSNSGRLIKFIPYPVVAGFMTGSAFLMVGSQFNPVTGASMTQFAETHWLPVTTAAVTFVAIIYVPRLVARVPGPVAGLLTGSLVFYLLSAITGTEAPAGWTVGSLPALTGLKPVVPQLAEGLPWGLIVPAALALAVLASLDSLLTSVVADTATHARHNARRELAGQGVAHMLAGLFGGLAGAGTTGATVVAIRSGGGRWVAVATAVMLLVIVLLAAPLAAWLPLSVLAGIILHVAVFSMFERSILVWIKHRSTRVDATIAVAVTLVTVFYDLMVAVGAGVVIAVAHFVREQVRAPVIHDCHTAAQRSSLRRRTDEERRLLEQHGDRVLVYRLRGNLFFGMVEHLFEILEPVLKRQVWLVFDMRRVDQVDLTAVRMLQQIAEWASERGGEVVFANVHDVRGLKSKVAKSLKRIAPYAPSHSVKTFIDTDEALEYAENCLLGSLGQIPADLDRQVLPAEVGLLRKLSPAEQQAILDVARPRQVRAGEVLFRAGDPGDALYIVLSGRVDILLPYGRKHYRRVASFGPGTYFGEVALLEPGPRTADARVLYEGELLVFDSEALHTLEAQSPLIASHMLVALGRTLADHLRWADQELRRLSD